MKKLQIEILIILVAATVTIPITFWISKSAKEHSIDEITELYSQIRSNVKPGTKLKFRTRETEPLKSLLFGSSIIAITPEILERDVEQDTILAVDLLEHSSALMYKEYEVIAKTYGNNYMLHLLIKKQ